MDDTTKNGVSNKGEFGEGNYKASQRYREKTEAFVESGRVDEAAENAAPESADEARELEDAERAGRERMKEEDPQLRRR
ncbi:MAG: hypothetical protein AB7K63_04025 [Vicinamibacterales bacterium]